jgi:hypothetical protein
MLGETTSNFFSNFAKIACFLAKIFFIFQIKIITFSQVPVAHTCNPSYSGSREQEDHGSKPAGANSS